MFIELWEVGYLDLGFQVSIGHEPGVCVLFLMTSFVVKSVSIEIGRDRLTLIGQSD